MPRHLPTTKAHEKRAKRLYALYFLVIAMNGVLIWAFLALLAYYVLGLSVLWALVAFFVGLLAIYPWYLYGVLRRDFSLTLHLSLMNVRDFDPSHLDERRIMRVVDELAISANIAPPVLHLAKSRAINAMTLHDGVCYHLVLTAGVRDLSTAAIYGVIGHEFGDIMSGDVEVAYRMARAKACVAALHHTAERWDEHATYHIARQNAVDFWWYIVPSLILRPFSWLGYHAAKHLGARYFYERELLADIASVHITRMDGVATALNQTRTHAYGSRVNLPIFIHHCCFLPPDGNAHRSDSHPSLPVRLDRKSVV